MSKKKNSFLKKSIGNFDFKMPVFKQPSFKTPVFKNPIFNKNVFSNTSKILNKYNLKPFGGAKDNDFDGVPNSKDCQPNNPMRQDFVPFKYNRNDEETNMSAAKRFGTLNIQNLQKLGQGRDRVVYALDKDKVLKVAKNPGGLTQNQLESDLDFVAGQVKHYETGKDYVVMERASPPSKATSKMLKHLKKAKDEAQGYQKHESQVRADFFNSEHFEASGLDSSDFSSHSVDPAEFASKRQWGEKDGQPVLIDGGALTSGQDLRRYRIKDFQAVANIDKSKEKPWQLTDWQDVQRERKQFRNKGLPRQSFKKQSYPEADLININIFNNDDSFQKGASLEKQREWQDMNTLEKIEARETKLDTDGDRVPDEYDCQPENALRQDWAVSDAVKKGHYVKWISPLEYLKKTNTDLNDANDIGMLQTYYDTEKEQMQPIKELGRHIKNPDIQVPLPYVEPDTSHEGRHRAYAAHLEGKQSIPVVLQPPENQRTPEIFEDFFNQSFSEKANKSYKAEWKKRFDSRIPAFYMGPEEADIYVSVLKKHNKYIEPTEPISDISEDDVSKNNSKPNKLQMDRIRKLKIAPATFEENQSKLIDDKQIRNNMYGALKRYPELLTDLENNKSIMLFGIKPKDLMNPDGDAEIYHNVEIDGKIVPKEMILVDMEKRLTPGARARLIKHEITHAEQIKGLSVEERDKRHDDEHEQYSYYERPTEIEAQEKAYLMYGKHFYDDSATEFIKEYGRNTYTRNIPNKTEEEKQLADERLSKLHDKARELRRENREKSINDSMKWFDISEDNVSKNEFEKGLKCVDCNKDLINDFVRSKEGPMCDTCWSEKARSGYWAKNYPQPKPTKEEIEASDYAERAADEWEREIMRSNEEFADAIDSIRDNEQANRTFSNLPLEEPEIPEDSPLLKPENWETGIYKSKKKTIHFGEYDDYEF